MNDQVQWIAPMPLWKAASASNDSAVRQAMRRPVVLRFATDTFMDDFQQVLENDSARLLDFIAHPETWRAPLPVPPPPEPAPRFMRRIGEVRQAAKVRTPQQGATARKTAQVRAGVQTVAVAGRTLTGLSPQSRTGAQASASALSAAAAQSAAKLLASQKQIEKQQKPQATLKLYQPAHQRYYLLAACLVCLRTGLPDHTLDTNREERVGCVMRRLLRPAGSTRPYDEYAFIVTPQGSSWQKVTDPTKLAPGEEQLPMFPFTFTEADGRKRRIFSALIPVGKREAYVGAGEIKTASNGSTSTQSTQKTARKTHFRMQVAEPWKNLIKTAADTQLLLQGSATLDPRPDTGTARKESRETVQTLSWYLLLDFARYIKQYLAPVWNAMQTPSLEAGLTTPEQNLIGVLKATTIDTSAGNAAAIGRFTQGTSYTSASIKPSLYEALKAIVAWETKLESVSVAYDRAAPVADWPSFLFPLAEAEEAFPVFAPALAPNQATDPNPADESGDANPLDATPLPSDPIASAIAQDVLAKQAKVDKLTAYVVRALRAESSEPVPNPPLASQPVLDTQQSLFVMRTVFERPFCGPKDPPILSDPTAQFELAGFFDSDAPARPIRIALPIDTTPGGLRKFDKNTAFMISDALCGQIQRLKGITFGDLVLSVLPWPFHKDLSSKVPKMEPCKSRGVQLGMICTFSIPIITICALILLMVIVLLFDFIFKWIPFFIMCFPLPGFKSKK